MKVFSIVTVTIIIAAITVRFLRLLFRKEIRPALAMWVIFSIAVTMSMVTYLAGSNYGFLDNIMNSIDVLYVFTITLSIFFFGDHTSRFTLFDKGCLLVVLLIVAFWIFTKNHLVTNLLIQAVMVIAYFPVVKRMVETKENTESFLVWIGMFLAPAFSLLSSSGTLAAVYSIRAMACVGTLLLLMLWIEKMKKRKGKAVT